MNFDESYDVSCPYCGALFPTQLDTSAGAYSTIIDCEVCCRPIQLQVTCHFGEVERVEVERA